MERLDKLLASTGRWSRREVRLLVKEGRVLVDGQPADVIDLVAADGVPRLSLGGIFKRFLNTMFLQGE